MKCIFLLDSMDLELLDCTLQIKQDMKPRERPAEINQINKAI